MQFVWDMFILQNPRATRKFALVLNSFSKVKLQQRRGRGGPIPGGPI